MVHAARLKVGRPFRHHFKPENLCEGGATTVTACMEHGLDDEGYDCSGLAIASICEALGIGVERWPQDFRHTKQLASLAIRALAKPGDLRVYLSSNQRMHLGIAISDTEDIHASGVAEVVEEGIAVDKYGSFIDVRTISLDSVCEIVARNRED